MKKPIEYNRLYENLNLRDKSDPKALVNIVPSWLADAIEAIPDSVLMMTEKELEKKVKPELREQHLRVSFWEEYQRITNRNADLQMNISNICSGICDHRVFQTIVKNSFTLAFILQAPVEVHVAMEDIVQLGLKQMRSIMDWPLELTGPDGETLINIKLALLKHKILQDAMDRRRGHVLQKIDMRSVNLHQHNVQPQAGAPQLTASEMEAQMRMEALSAPANEEKIIEHIVNEHGSRDVEEII